MLVLKLSRASEFHFTLPDGTLLKIGINQKERSGGGVSLVMEMPKTVTVVRINEITMGKKHDQSGQGGGGEDQGCKEG